MAVFSRSLSFAATRGARARGTGETFIASAAERHVFIEPRSPDMCKKTIAESSSDTGLVKSHAFFLLSAELNYWSMTGFDSRVQNIASDSLTDGRKDRRSCRQGPSPHLVVALLVMKDFRICQRRDFRRRRPSPLIRACQLLNCILRVGCSIDPVTHLPTRRT
jgi:hypothetical protein